MNLYTQWIIDQLGCSVLQAIQIQDTMATFLDFSECTKREFRQAVKDAVEIIKETA
jgi:hypothetical protein